MKTSSTRAVRIHETGGPERLVLEEIELPPPGEGQARVRHTAIAVNYIDTYHRTGLYPLPSLPCPLGVEAVGVVEEVGQGAAFVRPGDRVGYVVATPGTYAERANVLANRLIPLPPSIADDVAAASLTKGMTAELLLRRVKAVGPETTLLLHAAAGGVGLLACQWASHLGARVIGTAGSDEKAAIAKAHGAAEVIVYTRGDFVARVRELTGGAGVDVVYDGVGRSTFEGSLACLKPRGMLVLFGQASGPVPPFDVARLGQMGSLFLTRPSLFHYIPTRAELLASARALFDVIERGAVKVHVDRTYPLADARRAHEDLQARKTTGSLVLVP